MQLGLMPAHGAWWCLVAYRCTSRRSQQPATAMPAHSSALPLPPQGIKRKLEAATTVSEKRMKLLGLKGKGGKPAGDADTVADLQLKPGGKVIMMGQVCGRQGVAEAGSWGLAVKGHVRARRGRSRAEVEPSCAAFDGSRVG